MRFKKLIAAISAAAMLLPALPFIPGTAPVAEAAMGTVGITGAAVVRSTAADFLTINTITTAPKSAADQIQIFSNADNGSQCGAYYQYELPDAPAADKVITLTFESNGTINATDSLHVISVGTGYAGVVGTDTHTAANVFKDVSAAYTASEKTVIDVTYPLDKIYYNVDITSISKAGTNAIFVYSDAKDGKRYDIKNASITVETVVWRASDQPSSVWAEGNDKTGVSYVVNSDNSLTMTAIDATNIRAMNLTAGGTSDLILQNNVNYTLHYTATGNWTGAASKNYSGTYIQIRALKSDGKTDAANTDKKNIKKNTEQGNFFCNFTPNEDSYGFFYFVLRDVAVGGSVTFSNIYVTAERYDVTFDSKGGSAVETQHIYNDLTAAEPTAPTREGCTFGGWYTDKSCTTEYSFNAPVTRDITLYAKWTSASGDNLLEEKIDLTDRSKVKLYRFNVDSETNKYQYNFEITDKTNYSTNYTNFVDGNYNTPADIGIGHYIMVDLGAEYPISTIKAYQVADADGDFVAVLPNCAGTSATFVKADLQNLIRTNPTYNTKTTENGVNCFTYSALGTDKHNIGNYRYLIVYNGGSAHFTLSELEVYEDKTEKGAYLSVRNFYNDHMVLQRGKSHVIKGYSSKGKVVTVEMTNGTNTQTATATPDSEGNWTASIPNMPAGLKPYTITITDDAAAPTVTLSDVLVGDVFLASGQSNMAYEAPRTATQNITQYSNTGGPSGSVYYKKGLYELQEPLANANIRFIKMRDDTAAESGLVTEDVPIWIDWTKSDAMVAETSSGGTATNITSEGVLQLSTLAAFFADARTKAEPDIPVGIIQASRGGSAIDIWSEGGRLYNNHIAPLDGLNIAGILWYQGCANANYKGYDTTGGEAKYHTDFEALIKNYRSIFNDKALPFMYVQLAPYKKKEKEYEKDQAGSQRFQVMREIQREMLDDPDVNTNLYMAVSMDTTEDSHHDSNGNIVNASLIHPLGKDTLGRRMAAAYGKMKDGTSAVIDGPLVSGASVIGDTVTVSFKSGTADGLTVVNPNYTYQQKGITTWQPNELQEFKLAGADGVYYNATAKVVGDTVQVTSAYVTEPKYVSYAYSELPKNPNLGNGAGLPASPFNIGMNGATAPAAPALTQATDVEKFEVTMNSNGGSAVESQSVATGEKAKQPKAPTKDGYVFSGWYTDSELTTEYDFDTAVSSNMTLYAKWSEVVSTYDSDYFKFESNSSDTISITKVVLDITQGGKSGTATKTYSDPVTISAGSAVDFYIRITGIPEGTEITKISLY